MQRQDKAYVQDNNKGGTIPRAPNHRGGAESPRGRWITAGALNHCGRRRKSQQCHKYFLQYSKFACERAQVRICGRKTCFLPRTPFNLVTPLHM